VRRHNKKAKKEIEARKMSIKRQRKKRRTPSSRRVHMCGLKLKKMVMRTI